MPKISNKKFWELYKDIPQELKDVLFSEKTTEDIEDVCKKNKSMENFDEINDYTAQVLLGILPSDDLAETLEKETNIEKKVAKKISREIFRLIFFPVKQVLASMHETEITPSAQIKAKPLVQKKSATPSGKDTYRETVD